MRDDKPCPDCRAIMELKQTNLVFEREGLSISIEGIWVYVCPQCEHESVPGPLAINLMNLTDRVFQAARELQKAMSLPLPTIRVLVEDQSSVAAAGVSALHLPAIGVS